VLTPFRFDDHGHVKFDWLDTRHHFSFGDYYNEGRMGFGPLRVINDDIIKAGNGFGFHPHRDMEIITYVRTGTVIHKDSLGNEGRTSAGDVQVMSAGRGIIHAEHADPDADTTLFQIWIHPRERGISPRWDQKAFPKAPVSDGLNLLVSGRAEDAGSDALLIHSDAAIYGGHLVKGSELTHRLKGSAYVVMSEGEATVNGTALKKGDGAEVTGEDTLVIKADGDAELLVIEL
jgi:redox-sensitive bicupin YhaK (pirin superfamily)